MASAEIYPRGTASSAYDQLDALNWSTLKHLAVSAKLLRYRLDHPRADTDALDRGRAIHCAIFEPGRWRTCYVAEPAVDRRTRDGKAARAAWLVELARSLDVAGAERLVARPDFGDGRTKAGRARKAEWTASVLEDERVVVGDEPAPAILGPDVEVLSAEEHALAQRCAAEVHSHPRAVELLRGGRAEEVVTWTDPTCGIVCKGRIDWIRPDGILDLKSTRRSTLRLIATDAARFLYHGQLAWYHDGAVEAGLIPPVAAPPHVLVVQTVEPYDVIPAQLSAWDLQRGRELYRSLVRRYEECRAAGWWPGLAPEIVELDLPEWAASGLAEVGEEDW